MSKVKKEFIISGILLLIAFIYTVLVKVIDVDNIIIIIMISLQH